MYLKMDQADIIRNNYVASCFAPPTFLHSHKFFELSFGVHGKMINVINNVPFNFEHGKCALIRPTDAHFFRFPNNKSLTVPTTYEHKDIYVTQDKFIEICNGLHPDLYTRITEHAEPLIFDISEDFFAYIYNQSLMLAEAMDLKNKYFTAIHTSIITAILGQWLEKEIFIKKIFPKWLNDILPNFNSATFLSKSITEIANDVGYSLPYFSSEFKKYVGISAVKYLIKKRCSFSKQLLAENNMKIIDISLLLGFANPSTYSKHFHEEYGITPKEYQKTKRTDAYKTKT